MSHFPQNSKKGAKFGGGRQFPKKNHYSPDGNSGNRIKPDHKHQEQLSEVDVGITEYVSTLDGYSAVIKARFSDFQVNEIDKDNRIAKLTDLGVPKIVDTSTVESVTHNDVVESPLDKLPQKTWDDLKQLVESLHECAPVELEAESFTKEERKEIHSCVKKYFGKDVVASTINKNGKTIMEFSKWNKKNNKDTRSEWPANTPEFVHFILYKEMMDTMDACFKLAQALRIPPIKISYAGVKDRRAKTTQWCCIKKYHPSKIISSLKKIKNLKVGNIEFKKQALKLGDLRGNRFRIALRNVIAGDELINASLNYVKEKGFINYYGLQRFGNDKQVPTYSIGIKLLQGAWKDAVNLILKVKPGDDPMLLINTAKKIYADTGDAAKALLVCDKRENSLEKKLLEGLAKNHGNDYVNALERIPRGIRLMYIHSFQSLVWNKLASKRIQEFGLKPVEGDLILIDEIAESSLEDDAAECDATLNDEEKTCTESSESNKKVELAKPVVRPLSADELDKYTIYDIVLPLPGFDVIYPENLKQHYKEVIENYGLKLDMPKQKVKTYNLSGTYRKLVQSVKDLEWEILYYNNPTDNLIRSDLEELDGKEMIRSVENGKYKAIVVSFTLNAASYATMVLREILKCNTSSSAQAELNNYGAKNETAEKQEVESLLANKEKYLDFMNSLFKDETDPDNGKSTKRELETVEIDSDTQNKKLKIDG